MGCSQCFHTACCVIFSVNVRPWEADRYDTVKDDNDGNRYLRRTGVGQCVYLSQENTCSIHGRAPVVCRTWHCTKDTRWPLLAEAYLAGKDKQTGTPTGQHWTPPTEVPDVE